VQAVQVAVDRVQAPQETLQQRLVNLEQQTLAVAVVVDNH
jgi:hypothetical protein